MASPFSSGRRMPRLVTELYGLDHAVVVIGARELRQGRQASPAQTGAGISPARARGSGGLEAFERSAAALPASRTVIGPEGLERFGVVMLLASSSRSAAATGSGVQGEPGWTPNRVVGSRR